VKLAAAQKEFAQLEKQAIVQRSNSCWSSPLHMVQKQNGSWRPCGDYRRLNLQTKPDRYTCPNIGDLTARLAGCTIFSKLDLRKGYHQVPVREQDVGKTAVITPFGTFEYLRIPFGLRNAGQTFQRLMDSVLAGLPYCFVYMDDVLVACTSPEQHVAHPEGSSHQTAAARLGP
jgi:Reverse transcriptase (RNA-dependent DNA polymerase)